MANDKKQTEHAHADHHGHTAEHFREKHLMLDPLPRGQMNDMVMESIMEKPTWKFWIVASILATIITYDLFYS